jgi:hypothetical protein
LIVFEYYLFFCALVFAALLILAAFDDITKGPDPKLGYVLLSPFFWAIVFAAAVPFVNLVTLLGIIIGYFLTRSSK